jgi:hypothetical protein
MLLIIWFLLGILLLMFIMIYITEVDIGLGFKIILNVLIIALFTASIFGMVTLARNSCTDTSYNVPIYSGSNGKVISGHFFLGSGDIETQDLVEYWVKNGVQLKKYSAPMSESVFIEDGENFIRYTKQDCSLAWLAPVNESITQFTFHVPEDSVAQMYEFK